VKSGLLYQALSALCFAITILSFAPWVSASSDGEFYCRKDGSGGCAKHCPSDKPICEPVPFNCPNGPCYACSGCKAM